ncbi:hypothetical protein DRO19_01340 [Candidatus Bathyarchaeota archaeon]|nr:MAG: hypothetical protein DRO19_01340 [Candidatus Bathyarchaeota archaeon]
MGKEKWVTIRVNTNLLEEYRKYKPETKGLTYTALVDMIIRERLAELVGRVKPPKLEVGVKSET